MADAIVTVKQTFNGKAMANVLCFSNMTENPTEIQTFADNLRAAYVTNIVASMHTSWVLEGIDVSFLGVDSVLYSVNVDFTLGPLAGTNAGEAYASQAALLVSTSFVGIAPNRGRIYLTGWTEASVNNGRFTSAAQTDATALIQDMADGITGGAGTCFLRILRRPSAVFPAFVSSPVQLVATVGSPATIRNRRLPVV